MNRIRQRFPDERILDYCIAKRSVKRQIEMCSRYNTMSWSVSTNSSPRERLHEPVFLPFTKTEAD